jgi:hypothetical protein
VPITRIILLGFYSEILLDENLKLKNKKASPAYLRRLSAEGLVFRRRA